jgi:hypothetical protein
MPLRIDPLGAAPDGRENNCLSLYHRLCQASLRYRLIRDRPEQVSCRQKWLTFEIQCRNLGDQQRAQLNLASQHTAQIRSIHQNEPLLPALL